MFKKFISGAVLVAAIAASSAHSAQAAAVLGTLPLAGNTVTENNTNLATSTVLTNVDTTVNGLGTDDFVAVPFATSFGPAVLDLTNFGAFSITNGTYGTFAAGSGSILFQSASLLGVKLDGVYSGFPGRTSSPANLLVTFSQSNVNGQKSISEEFTLSATAIPEPGSVALLIGTGISGGFLALRRRRK